ncbi:unnamed protein product [Closterium sp. Naga37s-1]|nr:unnamed protein product [Closterium sp. Naga37s-1]
MAGNRVAPLPWRLTIIFGARFALQQPCAWHSAVAPSASHLPPAVASHSSFISSLPSDPLPHALRSLFPFFRVNPSLRSPILFVSLPPPFHSSPRPTPTPLLPSFPSPSPLPRSPRQYISGAILFDETLYQSTAGGEQFVDVLRAQGIVPGIKVDTGLQPIDGTDGETATQGLDGLADRCKRYYQQGARFAKWRAVIKVDDAKHPTSCAVVENVHGLARYAQIAQANGLVPIVEPEVTLGDGDYSIERTAYVSEMVYSHVFRMLNEYNIILEGILLKPNMILPGLDAPNASPEDVARYSVRTMRRCVPAAVPGVHFLSGGMSEEEATNNLNALQAYGPHPWSLTFSYGRALQASTLKIWSGKPENKAAAQERLVALAKANSEAQLGKYKGPHPSPGGGRILQALRLGGGAGK